MPSNKPAVLARSMIVLTTIKPGTKTKKIKKEASSSMTYTFYLVNAMKLVDLSIIPSLLQVSLPDG